MGVSVEGGKGRGKSMGVDLNLVPFIDFLSCLLAFLMITAAWNQIAAIEIEQSISPPDPNAPPPEKEPLPPLTVHVRADGHWIARKATEGVNIPRVGESYDYARLEEVMRKDRETYPKGHPQEEESNMIVINTDDGVSYDEMMRVLDMSREIGYPKTLLAGGAPGTTQDGPPAAPAGGK